jgi:hypothetical protein
MKPCYDHDSGAGLITHDYDWNSEHDKVQSKLTGKMVEIEFGPLPAAPDPSRGGEMAYNPFRSKAQQRFMFAAEARGELKKGTAEKWAHETPSIKSLPNKVKK